MSDVKRYRPSHEPLQTADGPYVLHSDYAALEEERRRGMATAVRLADELCACIKDRDELRSIVIQAHAIAQVVKRDQDELRAALREAIQDVVEFEENRLQQPVPITDWARPRTVALLLRLGDLEQTADGLRWRAGT